MNQTTRYIIYVRKSTESEDRQVLSIDSQIKELKDWARRSNLQIAEIISESKSAKAPGRPGFNSLMDKLYKGKVNGILCWKLDRLARNPVDGGTLIWAVEEGKIQEIATPQRSFRNTGNDKFWMQLEFGMAKKYVDDLSDNVKRGLRAKLGQGWLPGLAPLGYLNDRTTGTITKDPDRFPLVRKLWKLVASGVYSPSQVLKIANGQWGLRTRQTRRLGNKPIGPSTLYQILHNPFYYGVIQRQGELFQGAHQPMITKEEFDKVQRILGSPDRPRPKTHQFAFTGLIRCGECGAAITAEEHWKPSGRRYVYYRCTRRKRNISCGQKPISLPELESQIMAWLERITISNRFRDWALKRLEKLRDEETQIQSKAHLNLKKRLTHCQNQLDNLIGLRLRDLLTDNEYLTQKRKFQEEEVDLKAKIQGFEQRGKSWFELSKRTFLLANQAKFQFIKGNLEKKREILSKVGLNYQLRDRILLIQAKKPFLIIEKGRKFPSWCAIVEEVRNYFLNHLFW